MNMFEPANIFVDSSASDRDGLLEVVAALGGRLGYVTDVADVVEAMKTREGQTTTALMDGIAIPHAKTTGISNAALVVVRTAAPVAWTGGEDVSVAVAMLVPEAEAGTTHLTLLAKVARALMDKNLRAVLVQGSEQDIYQALSAKLG